MKCLQLWLPFSLAHSLRLSLSRSRILCRLGAAYLMAHVDMLMHLASTWLPLLAAPQNMLHFSCSMLRQYPARPHARLQHANVPWTGNNYSTGYALVCTCWGRLDSAALTERRKRNKLLLSPKRTAKYWANYERERESLLRILKDE